MVITFTRLCKRGTGSALERSPFCFGVFGVGAWLARAAEGFDLLLGERLQVLDRRQIGRAVGRNQVHFHATVLVRLGDRVASAFLGGRDVRGAAQARTRI